MNVEQDFCQDCGGVKSISLDGKVISPLEWHLHGFASDLGCICRKGDSSC